MKEHFKSSAHMRSTYPWLYAGWVTASAISVGYVVAEVPEGVLTNIMTVAAHISLYSALMDLGREHYRYGRYLKAKKTYERYMEQNQKLGWE